MQAGRLANVAGALLVMEEGVSPPATSGTLRAGAGVLRALFEETLALGIDGESDFVSRVVSPPAAPRSPLADLAALLEASAAERLLVLWPGVAALPEDLPAALSAWPERDVVRIDADDGRTPLCAIFRREPVLERAQSALSEGRRDLSALDGALDVERATPAVLGLEDEQAGGFGVGG